MPPGCDHAVNVRLNDRSFIVEFNEVGEILRIKERKQLFNHGPEMSYYNVSYWVPSSHPLGTGNTLPKRIIAAARAKMAFDATP